MTLIRQVPRLWWPALTLLLMVWSGPIYGQTSPAPAADQTGSAATATADQNPPLTEAQLEQLVAQIALYPDPLLAQILMASTYPLEVVSAARWVTANAGLTGDDQDKALAQENWDLSVKSLVAFPQVLQMMNDEIDWTEQLGDAFLAQQSDVMKAVQTLRSRAQAAGNLQSGPQQTVTVAPAAGGSSEVIVIQPTEPQVVYVPTYDPTVVYGAWPYPNYQPYSWRPAGYVAGNVISFGLGLAIGNNFWGDCDWRNGYVNVNVNNYNNFVNRFPGPHPPGPYPGLHPGGNGPMPWNHDPDHRRGVPYQNPAIQDKFMGSHRAAANEKAREQFRGHADQQRAHLAGLDPKKIPGAQGGGAQQLRPGHQERLGAGGAGERRANPAVRQPTQRPEARRPEAQRPEARRPAAQRPEAVRPSGGGQGERVFSNLDHGGQARQDSRRGQQSQKRLTGREGGSARGGGNLAGGASRRR